MMEDPPHVGADSTNIENIIQSFIYRPRRGNGVVVAVVSNVEQKEGLRDRIQKVEGDELPGVRFEGVKSNPAACQHGQPYCDFDPHGEVGLGRNAAIGKKIVEAAAQDFGEGRLRGRGGNGVPQRGLGWYKIINLWVQINSRLVTKPLPEQFCQADTSRAGFARESTRPAGGSVTRHHLRRKCEKLA